jgi:hypothetical protein
MTEEVFNLLQTELSEQVTRNIFIKTEIHTLSKCWLYQGSLSEGYARVYHKNRLEFLHRLIAKLKLNYDLNSELYVLHQIWCFNKNCWNPEHLYIGTQADNVLDQKRVGTFRNVTAEKEKLKTHCPQGHEYTLENTQWQGNKRKCRECSRLRKSGGKPRKRSTYSSIKIREDKLDA